MIGAIPPIPTETAEALRWEETRRRERILSGTWDYDLERVLTQTFGKVRRPIIGRRSKARNPFRQLCVELACNYQEKPLIEHNEGEFPELLGCEGLLEVAGLWPLMKRFQPRLIGLREMALHLDWSLELQRPVVRMVRPDCLVASAYASAPGVPRELSELRLRTIGGRQVWTWDDYSIAGNVPFFRVISFDKSIDYTATLFGQTFEGDAYPWRWTRGAQVGRPFLPYVLYHAAAREKLWNPWEGVEVVDGTLDLAAGHTYLQHTLFRAAFPQRWALNVVVAGASPVDTWAGARVEVPTDPTGLIHLENAPDLAPGSSAQIGQWGPGADPEMIARVLEKLDAAIATFDGVGGVEVVRNSSNPMSAEALLISREGKRQAQVRYAGELEPGDTETLAKFAAICNLELGTSFPESGYDVDYRLLPLSPTEAEARRKHAAELIQAGRMSIVDAYLLEHPGMLRSEAERESSGLREENKKYGVQPGTQPSAYTVTPPVPASAAPSTAPAANIALDGTQVESVKSIVADVMAGKLPRDAGINMLIRFFNLNEESANQIMGSAGATPKVAGQAPAGGQ